MQVETEETPLLDTPQGVEEEYIKAVSCTLAFVQDLGAHIAAHKSFSATTHKSVRASLKRRTIVVQGQVYALPVAQDFRDLGGHISTTAQSVAPTLTKRLARAPQVCRAVAALPIDSGAKAHLIQGKVLPAAL
eukprot:3782210-Alexandrium_andersonii.AAC.2